MQTSLHKQQLCQNIAQKQSTISIMDCQMSVFGLSMRLLLLLVSFAEANIVEGE